MNSVIVAYCYSVVHSRRLLLLHRQPLTLQPILLLMLLLLPLLLLLLLRLQLQLPEVVLQRLRDS